MANKVLESALAPEPLMGTMQEDNKTELERILNEFDSPSDYLAQAQNTTIYAGLSGDDPNKVFEYADMINEQLYGTPNHETALANNKKASEAARITLGERLKSFTIFDALEKIPFSPFFGLKKGLIAATKKKIETGKFPVTSFAGLSLRFGELVGALDITKDQQKKLVEHYEKEFKREKTIPATIFDGVTMLPAYMVEFYTGGVAAKAIGLPVKGVKGAFAASSIRTLIQPHRVASSFIDQEAKGEPPATALFKAYGDVYIENISEAAGEGFIPLVKKLPLGSKLIGALVRVGKKLHIPESEVLKRISTKAGWNGLVSEWGEERLGTELRAIFDVEDFGLGPDSSIPDRMAAGFLADMTINNQLAEAGVLSFPFATKMLASKIIGSEPIEIEEVSIPAEEAPTEPVTALQLAAKPKKPTEPIITPAKAAEVEGEVEIRKTRKQIKEWLSSFGKIKAADRISPETSGLKELSELNNKIYQQKVKYNTEKAGSATTIRLDESGGKYVIISPSAKQKGRWQLTKFDEKGPFEDTTRDTKQEALDLISGKESGTLDWSDNEDYLVTEVTGKKKVIPHGLSDKEIELLTRIENAGKPPQGKIYNDLVEDLGFTKREVSSLRKKDLIDKALPLVTITGKIKLSQAEGIDPFEGITPTLQAKAKAKIKELGVAEEGRARPTKPTPSQKVEELRQESARLANEVISEEGKLSSLRTGRDVRGKVTEKKKEAWRIELGRKEREVAELKKKASAAEKAYRLAAISKAKPVEKKEEIEAPEEAKEAEKRLEAEAAEEIEPELYIGHVTEGMKRRIEERTQFKAEDIQGFKKGAFPTIRTKIKMARGEAEQYLEFLEDKIIDDLDNNRIRTENDLARLNAEWGDIAALRKVLGIPKGTAPFRVMRAGKHKVEIIESVKARIKEAVRPTVESKMTVGEVLRTVMRRTARATKMGFVTGRRELRAQIRARKRAKKRMNKAIKTIGQKISTRVDFFYREAIEALREGIDLASRSEKTLAQRKATTEFIKRIPEKAKDIPIKLMKQIHQKPLNDFTIEELEEVATEVEKLIEQGKLKRSLKLKPQLEERKRNVETLTINTESVKPSRVKIGPKVVSTTKQGLMETVFDKIKAWTWTPQRLFDMLDGGKNFSGLWHKIFYDDPKEAKRKAIRKSMERRNAGLDKMKKLGLSMYQLSGSRIVGEVKYSIQELMGIYMASENRLSKLVLRYGHELSDADITNAINALTSQEKALADFMLNDYEENYSRLRRSVIEQENRNAPAEENYSPIRRIGDFSKTLESEIIDSMLRREQVRRHNVAHGFTLERKDVPKELQTPMRLEAINVWLDQVEKQERYIYIGPQVRNMNKILANKELRRTVGNRFGNSILKTLDGYVSSVANPYVYKHFNDPERASSYLRRNAVIAYLGFNFVTMGKQLPSAFLYLPDAGPSHLMASALDFATNPMRMIKKVRELDPQLANRSLERELEEIKNSPNANFIKSKIGQYGLEGIYLFDTIARTIGWNAVYERALADDKSPAESIRLAQNATLRTQPAAAAEDIPALYRTNEFLNWFTMFTNQLNKLFNITTYDIPSYIKNEEYSKAALQSIGMGIVALTIWAVTNRALPDEPEEFIEAIGEQAINMIPVFGKPIMAARKGWGADIPLFEGVKGLAKATTDLELTRSDTKAIAEGIAVTTGIPYTAIRRGIQAIEERQPSAIFGGRRPKKRKSREGFGGF